MVIFLFLISVYSIYFIGLGCSADTYQCDSGACLPIETRCNGLRECPNGSDERNCRMYIFCHFSVN